MAKERLRLTDEDKCIRLINKINELMDQENTYLLTENMKYRNYYQILDLTGSFHGIRLQSLDKDVQERFDRFLSGLCEWLDKRYPDGRVHDPPLKWGQYL